MSKINDMKVKQGETVSRQTVVDAKGQTVRLFNVSHNKVTDSDYKVNWTFDFSTCTPEELLELASRSAVIAYRKNFRNVKESEIPDFAERTINVHDAIMVSERKGKTKEERARSLLANMSEEERKAILAEYGLK